jgi:plasmid maintenance system antidote protein VapI
VKRDEFKPAEVFPLSEFLAEELTARGWTAADVCARCCLSAERVEAILAGDRLSLQEAEPLAYALEVSAELLLRLQLIWHKWEAAP